MENERLKKVEMILSWALDKKAENAVHIDVTGKTDFTDSIIICEGSVPLHVRAIAQHILQKAAENKMQILSKEGIDNAKWILLDFIDIIVHIFDKETRSYYCLEDLYKVNPKNNKQENKNAEKQNS
jgi:ribosome-associated protein